MRRSIPGMHDVTHPHPLLNKTSLPKSQPQGPPNSPLPEQMYKLCKTFPGSFHLLDCYPSIVHSSDRPDDRDLDLELAMDAAPEAPLNECAPPHVQTSHAAD